MFFEIFAAANTYFGFESHFSETVDYKRLTKLFILKGGPGTGKSSFMKKAVAALEKNSKITKILCSSDKSSLDGVIIEKGSKRIAILDGTAPHVVDPMIPGARDIIINLGENWSDEILSENIEKIESLTREKIKCYDTAYSYLRISGEIDREIDKIISGSIDFSEIDATIGTLIERHSGSDNGSSSNLILSSFGCDGYTSKIRTAENEVSVINLPYSIYTANILFKSLENRLLKKGVSTARVLSPLLPSRLEGLYLNDENIIYFIDREITNIKDDPLIRTRGSYDVERIRVLCELLKFSEDEAVRWFGIAKDFHLRLEDIYSFSMDFSKNDIILSKTLEKIKNILEISD